MPNLQNLRKYGKAIVAIAGLLAVVGASLSNGSVNPGEIFAAIIAVLVALGVYTVPNAAR